MDKGLIDRVWKYCLPKEFKEEVKDDYKELVSVLDYFQNKISLNNEECDRCDLIREKRAIYNKYFGKHNLTSDAEGEEMLTVPRKKVEEKWQRAYEQEAKYSRAQDSPVAREELYYNRGILSVLDTLFGANCLPDELTEDNFANKEPLHGDNLSPEPQPANRTPSSYTQPVTNCPQIDRLHIAAMAMQALLSNADRMKMYEDIASYPPSDNLTRIVARNALRYADALVAEAHKPTQC